ncbi:DUF2933 domain-containing protein [Paraburkholderia fungorum]|uniref:DUF2933 domain-containing protein n=1 Tax=Paraburkholderia fungorum TaxID=134537 RepID=UPI001604810F
MVTYSAFPGFRSLVIRLEHALLILACPLSMLLMMNDMGSRQDRRDQSGAGTAREPRAATGGQRIVPAVLRKYCGQ